MPFRPDREQNCISGVAAALPEGGECLTLQRARSLVPMLLAGRLAMALRFFKDPGMST